MHGGGRPRSLGADHPEWPLRLREGSWREKEGSREALSRGDLVGATSDGTVVTRPVHRARVEREGHLQVPAWYLRALTLCLWAVNVRTCSPVSASQHLTVLSALPEYTCRFAS